MQYLPLGWILAAPLPFQLIYFAVSIVIGAAGVNRKMGFWGYLFCSVLFSPLIGLMVLLASDKKQDRTADRTAA
ncbi:MAG: hypothetical protein BWK80_29430 [Desulfobacteraceae bacterium IS3]|nr:MAG: hypothetical protein BWK80_29430 [Desulfobacteraceae bacterium IS3]